MSTSRLKTLWQRGTKTAAFFRKTLTYSFIGYGSYQAYIIYRKQQDLLRIPEETILTWKLDKSYVTEARQERTGMISALSRGSAPLTLLEALRVLHHAKTDDRVTGLMMDLSMSGLSASRTGLGFAQIQELRNEIQAFAEEKRKRIGDKFRLVAYTDTFDSQLHYYLASVFDEVRMEPVGNIPLIGVGTLQLFFKNILDRVGLGVRAYSRGDYKGVNAPWTSEKWTKPIRENMERLLSSMNDQLVKGIADARSEKIQQSITSQQSHTEAVKHTDEDGTVVEEISFAGVLSKAKDALTLVRSIMNYSPISSEEAKTWGLVDKLGYKRDSIEMNPEAFGLQTFPRTKLVVDPKDPTRLIQSLSFSRYKFAVMQEKQRDVKQQLAQGKPKATVGLVYLTGTVRRGDTQFSSNQVVKALMEAANDPEVDSIVFRVDTGGGDPVASETIWEAVKFVQDQRRKPVIASFGNVSASGGYYATTGCSKILASPGTITGSIGVAALRPLVTEKLLSTLGVTFDEIYFSDSVKNNSIFHDLEGSALKRYQDMTDNLYEIFKKRVSEGRGKSMEWVEQVAGGRVWSGVDALKEGLIDEIGGISRSIEVAGQIGYNNRAIRDLKILEGITNAAKKRQESGADMPTKGHPEMIRIDLPPLDLLMDDSKPTPWKTDNPLVLIKPFPQPKSLLQRISDTDTIEEGLQLGGVAIRTCLADIIGGAIRQSIQSELGDRVEAATGYPAEVLEDGVPSVVLSAKANFDDVVW